MPPGNRGPFFIAYRLHTINGTKQHENARFANAPKKEKPLKCSVFKGFRGGSEWIRTTDTPGMNREVQRLEALKIRRFT